MYCVYKFCLFILKIIQDTTCLHSVQLGYIHKYLFAPKYQVLGAKSAPTWKC